MRYLPLLKKYVFICISNQLGNLLRKLSLLQVFGAIRQAVQKAPHYPETHNLHGLVCEARSEYQAAITSFRLARCAINISSGDTSKSRFQEIAVNLARSLSKVIYISACIAFVDLEKYLHLIQWFLALCTMWVNFVIIFFSLSLAKAFIWCRLGMLLMLYKNVKVWEKKVWFLTFMYLYLFSFILLNLVSYARKEWSDVWLLQYR